MIGTDLRYLRRNETARGIRNLETFVLLEFSDPNPEWYLRPVSTNGREDATGTAKPKTVGLAESVRYSA